MLLPPGFEHYKIILITIIIITFGSTNHSVTATHFTCSAIILSWAFHPKISTKGSSREISLFVSRVLRVKLGKMSAPCH